MKMKKLEPDASAQRSTETERADRRLSIPGWIDRIRLVQSSAKELFSAYKDLTPSAFTAYVEAHPPTPAIVMALLDIALAADDPVKLSFLGKARANKLYGAARKAVLAAWATYCTSASYKSKAHFAGVQAKTLKDARGEPIAESTILRWLPKKK